MVAGSMIWRAVAGTGRAAPVIARKGTPNMIQRSNHVTAKLQVTAQLLCLAFAFVLGACQSNAAQPSPEALGKPGDCDLFKQRLCEFAGAKTPGCEASELVINLFSDSACAQGLKDFGQVKEKHELWRAPCEELAMTICDKSGQDSLACKTVKDQVEALLPKECERLLLDPAPLIENLRLQEVAMKPLDAAGQARISEAGAPSFGPEDAKVTVVQFADFEDAQSARASFVTKAIKEKYGDRVRFIFRHFPLSHHRYAIPAAQGALAAQAEGKFWEYHDLVFDNQDRLDTNSLIEHARKLGLNVERFREGLKSEDLVKMVTADQFMGLDVGVTNAPTMFINGKRAQDAGHWDSVKDAIEAALAAAPGG
jgi:protein-disulfide isomerase